MIRSLDLKLFNIDCLFILLKPQVTQINVESPLHNLLWGREEGRGYKKEKSGFLKSILVVPFTVVLAVVAEERLITRLFISVPA